jgi:hypothetical protein
MVRNLLDPSMYRLVYGRSRVLAKESVGVEDVIRKWAGKGHVLINGNDITERPHDDIRDRCLPYIPRDYWSDNYQWLPANVAFQDDGSVKFTSYINNLHPNKYPEIYRTIEKLIDTSIPAWDQCLTLDVNADLREGAGRMHSRFSMTMPHKMK